MKNKKLTNKDYWDDIYQRNFYILNTLSNFRWLQSYYHFVFQKILSRYIDLSRHKNVLEVGCAPGNYLVKLNRFFSLTPFGVEYAEKGYQETIQNFERNKLPGSNIFLMDFFSENFQKQNYERYDLVFSAGFIEHFSDPRSVILKQLDLTKKGGLLICLIPNVRYLNEWISPRDIVSLHNQSIMERSNFRKIFLTIPKTSVLYCEYFGGVFNFGMLNMKNYFLKLLVIFLLIIQRFTLDLLQKIVFILFQKDFTSRYTSPSLLCILRKE